MNEQNEKTWDEYRKHHRKCPKCGNSYISQTLLGYHLPPDLNRATCHTKGCGWVGTVDDLK